MSKIPKRSTRLYDPSFERDSCGVVFIAKLSGKYNGKKVERMAQWAAYGCEKNIGDGTDHEACWFSSFRWGYFSFPQTRNAARRELLFQSLFIRVSLSQPNSRGTL